MSTSAGYNVVRNPSLNKGHSFSASERKELKIEGFFPAGAPFTLEKKIAIALAQFSAKATDIEKYTFLHTIQDSDETLFYALLINYTSIMMPIVYTPTVGEACLNWGRIYRHTPRGLYLSINDKGRIREILNNQPHKNIKVIVVTDGERILGLGDQGINGMGIPIGKLALYTACAGIHPEYCLPVHIDVGTERVELRNELSYMGLRQKRVRGQEYDDLIAEFFAACHDAYGKTVLIQFEDFGNLNAFRLLEQHQHTACCFNDDIQGTASVALAGVIASLPLSNKAKVSDHTFLFYGAGEAGTGIANQITAYVVSELQCTPEEARARIWLVDSQGLVTSDRLAEGKPPLPEHKLHFAHTLSEEAKGRLAAYRSAPVVPSVTGCTSSGSELLLEAIAALLPSALIGVSAQPGAFDERVCSQMVAINGSHTPLIFALSNPTSKAECTAEQAYHWTDGRCVFCSGSPFPQVTMPDGRVFEPGQGNNSYIFPGMGLAALVSEAITITDEDMTIAAATLAALVTPERLALGCVYPPLTEIRSVSLHIASAVALHIIQTGRSALADTSALMTLEAVAERCNNLVYVPSY